MPSSLSGILLKIIRTLPTDDDLRNQDYGIIIIYLSSIIRDRRYENQIPLPKFVIGKRSVYRPGKGSNGKHILPKK